MNSARGQSKASYNYLGKGFSHAGQYAQGGRLGTLLLKQTLPAMLVITSCSSSETNCQIHVHAYKTEFVTHFYTRPRFAYVYKQIE